MLRVNFDVGQNRHVIGVADPPGDNVHVNVFVESRAASLAQVSADVESFRRFDSLEYFHTFAGQVVEFGIFFFIHLGDARQVAVGGDHQVAGIVWINVHDDEAGVALMQDEIFFILIGLWENAEYAFARLILFDIFHSPGSPNLFHRLCFRR